jgi:hypothetical protein
VDRVRDTKRGRGHARRDLRVQSTAFGTRHGVVRCQPSPPSCVVRSRPSPPNGGLKEREDGLSAHRRALLDGVWGGPILVKQGRLVSCFQAVTGAWPWSCTGRRNLATGPGFLAEAPEI